MVLMSSSTDRGKGVPSFDEMMDIALLEVDFDDPTTNVRGRRALAIAKPTSEGLLTMPEHDQPDHEGLFSYEQTKNKQETEIAIWILGIEDESFIDQGAVL